MTPEEATDLIRLCLFIIVEISGPTLVILLVIGLGVSIFQSVTQITETTLIFIPKLVSFGIIFGLTFPWILKILLKFMGELWVDHWNYIIQMSALGL